MIKDFIIPLLTVSSAELGDKSQLSLFIFSCGVKSRWLVLLGSLSAFAVVDGIAILGGEWATSFLPMPVIKIISGIVFLTLGIIAFINGQAGKEKNYNCATPLASSFSLVFFSEWGDKTQIASMLFAAKYDCLMVFAGVLVAMAVLSALAIYLGGKLSEKINRKKINLASGVIFIIISLFSLLSVV